MEVVRPEDYAKDDKLPLNNIEQKYWVAVHMYEWQAKKQQEEDGAHHLPPVMKPAGWFFWKKPYPLTLLIYCGDMVSVTFGVDMFVGHAGQCELGCRLRVFCGGFNFWCGFFLIH